jgi:ribosomal protein S18 acetylase RimI-like enzyme
MRCLNVVERWPDTEGRTIGIAGEVTLSFVAERLRRLGITTHPAAEVGYADVLLVDTYDAASRVACGDADATVRVLVDDAGELVPPGYSVVVNPNAYGAPGLYAAFPGPVLTGPENVPLRGDLPTWSGAGRGRLGAALGGALPPQLLREALTLVAETSGAQAHIAARPFAQWAGADEGAPWQQLADCDTVIVAGGAMMWEAAAVGVPSVVVQLAHNQRLAVSWAEAQGVPVVDAVGARSSSALGERIAASLPHARPLPPIRDGSRGLAERLRDALRKRETADGIEVSLRRAEPDDARTLWTWANDADTRAASLISEPIAWPDHVAWLHARLDRNDHLILIAESAGGQPIASVRFDTQDGWSRARLSVVVAPEQRGHGVGSTVVRAGVERLREDHPDVTVVAAVKRTNDWSARMFRRLRWCVEDATPDRLTFWSPGRSN